MSPTNNGSTGSPDISLVANRLLKQPRTYMVFIYYILVCTGCSKSKVRCLFIFYLVINLINFLINLCRNILSLLNYPESYLNIDKFVIKRLFIYMYFIIRNSIFQSKRPKLWNCKIENSKLIILIFGVAGKQKKIIFADENRTLIDVWNTLKFL